MSAASMKVQDVLEMDPVSARISQMREAQKEMRNQRKALAAQLKAAEKRRCRLRKRAKALTDDDLVQVLMMRKQQRGSAAASASESVPQLELPPMSPVQEGGDAQPQPTAEDLGLTDDERT